MIDLLAHELLVLLRCENLLKLRIGLYHILHSLRAGVANLAFVCKFEEHTINRIPSQTVLNGQLAHQHFGLLTSHILRRTLWMMLRQRRDKGQGQ